MIGASAAQATYVNQDGYHDYHEHNRHGIQLTPIRESPSFSQQPVDGLGAQPPLSPVRGQHRRPGVSPMALHSQTGGDRLAVPDGYDGAPSQTFSTSYDDDYPSSSTGSHISYDSNGEIKAPLTKRQRVYQFFEEPNSSRGAFIFSLFFFVLILVSSLTLCLETLPQYHTESSNNGGPWFTIETICVIFFTVEFIARFATTPSYAKFLRNPMNYADLLSILPYYFEIAFSSEDIFDLRNIRMIRLARVFRVFKLSRYSVGLQVTGRAMMQSAEALTMLVFFTAIALMIFASAMYYAERGSWSTKRQEWIRRDNRRSPYQSIPDSFWWCITTLTTVGYGDDVPLTEYGKLIAGLTMMAGILIIALPTSVIGANFMQEWRKHELQAAKAAKQKEVHQQLGRQPTPQEAATRLQQDHDRLVAALQMISEHVRDTQHIYTVKAGGGVVPQPPGSKYIDETQPRDSVRDPAALKLPQDEYDTTEASSSEIRQRLVRAEMRIRELEQENARLRDAR